MPIREQISIYPSPINGDGLFALSAFKSGETICRSEGYIIDLTTRSLETWESRISYQLSANHHFVPTGTVVAKINALANLNHSCIPNAYVQFSPRNGFLVLKASKRISGNEEITCDYYVTETELAHPFPCQCGMDNCRGFMRGQLDLK